MFFTKHDTFEAIFYCRFEGYKATILDPEEWGELDDSKQKAYEKYEVRFKPLSWGAHSELKGGCFYVDVESNMRVFNYDKYSMDKLCKVVVDWNLTRTNADGEEEKVDPTDEMVRRLHPLVAQYMVDLYETEVEMSGEAEKN